MTISDPVLEELKWKQFESGSGGTICLVDTMGTDYSVVEAARVSYGAGTSHTSSDRTLIRYLMRHWHTTPFEMCELKFRVRVPMDTWRQWIRHRTASVNEYSTRYSEAIDECEVTLPGEWRLQATDNKQGSDGFAPQEVGEFLSRKEKEFQQLARTVYQERIDHGIARERARKDLPLSNYTEAYWKVDLHNLFHFLRLRMDGHAQKEIRDFATIVGDEIVSQLFPLCWEAFVDYRLESLILTRLDIGVIQRMMTMPIADIGARQAFDDAQPLEWATLKTCRERQECFEKLQQLGVIS